MHKVFIVVCECWRVLESDCNRKQSDERNEIVKELKDIDDSGICIFGSRGGKNGWEFLGEAPVVNLNQKQGNVCKVGEINQLQSGC